MMEDRFARFVAQLRKMRDAQKALVESETRVNFSNAKTYSVLDVEKENLAVLVEVLAVADNTPTGDGDDAV